MKSFLSLSSLAVLVLASPAFAGFEWIPPHTQTRAPVISQPAVPADRVIDYIQSGRATAPVSAPAAMPEPVSATPVEAPPPVILPAPEPVVIMPGNAPASAQVTQPASPSTPAPQVNPVKEASSVPHNTLVGFGDDIPLAMALNDIVPDSYSYAFSSGVNPGVSVSWDGQGRNWDAVLSDMLAAEDLSARLRGRTVLIVAQAQTPVRVQQSATPTHTIRAPKPPLEPVYSHPPAAGEPFSQNYEPIILSPDIQ